MLINRSGGGKKSEFIQDTSLSFSSIASWTNLVQYETGAVYVIALFGNSSGYGKGYIQVDKNGIINTVTLSGNNSSVRIEGGYIQVQNSYTSGSVRGLYVKYKE